MNGEAGTSKRTQGSRVDFGMPEAAFWEAPGLIADLEAPPPRSPVERLLDTFEAHRMAEADSLAAYERLVEGSPDPVVALLIRLVLEDEERHHGLLGRMAASVRDALEWTHSAQALPTDLPPKGAATSELVATTKLRLKEERESIRQLRRLARAQGELYDGLFTLLLEIMAMDSQKHERIMSYILQRLESQP